MIFICLNYISRAANANAVAGASVVVWTGQLQLGVPGGGGGGGGLPGGARLLSPAAGELGPAGGHPLLPAGHRGGGAGRHSHTALTLQATLHCREITADRRHL